MKFLLIVAALLAFLAACAAPVESPKPSPRRDGGSCDRTFIVSSDFPAREHEALQRAADRWNEIAVEQFCLAQAEESLVPPNMPSRAVFRMKHGGEYWQSLSDSHGGIDVIGVHLGDSDQIGFVDDLSEADFELVALHEFGHAHDLGHVAAPAIMHASIRTASDFTSNDLAECQRVGACLKEDEDG